VKSGLRKSLSGYLALAAVAAAAAVTAGAFAQLRRIAARVAVLERRLAEVQRWRAVEDETAAVLSRLQERRRNIPVNLQTVLARTGCASWCRVEGPRIAELLPGWQLYRAAVRLEAIPAADLIRLVKELENSRPPWRVVRYRLIPAGEGQAGAGAALSGELELEAVGRRPEWRSRS